MEQEKRSSPHILNAASNLLGICFILLTSLKLLNGTAKSVIDEITVAATVMFMLSCILSFLSIRSRAGKKQERFEQVADVVFLVGLSILFITILLFSTNIIQ